MPDGLRNLEILKEVFDIYINSKP